MYTDRNFKTKKALKESVANGDQVSVYEPGPFPGTTDGKVYIEGPHYPEPHRWYASAIVENGVIVPGSVK